MAKSAIEKQLRAIPLFSEYSSRQIASVARLTTTIDVAEGRELISEGKAGRELFLVLDGEAEIRHEGAAIATRGPGSFVGETALLLDQPRNATVVATTAMTIGVIERNDFRQLLSEHPDLYAPLVDAIAKRLPEVDDTH
jgi:CRP-like cAMP-binding protein